MAHKYTPKILTKSTKLAKGLNLDEDIHKRLGNKIYVGQERMNKKNEAEQ